LWGFKIEKEENGKYWIDATEFLFQDAANVSGTLQRSNQGTYKIDKSRSALYLDGIRNFPKNSEFEALLTFTGNPTGRQINSVTPTAASVTVRQHHSFIELPDDNYQPRFYDPRAGFFDMTYMGIMQSRLTSLLFNGLLRATGWKRKIRKQKLVNRLSRLFIMWIEERRNLLSRL